MKPYVMDSSGALAILLDEKGGDMSLRVLPEAQCSAVNATEIVARLIDEGRTMEEAGGFAGLGVPVAPFGEVMGIFAGQLRAATRAPRPLPRRPRLSGIGDPSECNGIDSGSLLGRP